MADKINITSLDFDEIKNNLKDFLRQQDYFTDYDFEGSGLNILLDVLAYNAHNMGYYLNMAVNESFLDTAVLRDSIVSHAKALGYTPFSVKSPVAIIDFEVKSSNSNLGTLTIPRGFRFLSNLIDGKSYKFINLNDVTVTKSNTSYIFESLSINEGELIDYTFNYDKATNPNQIFTIPDNTIDTTTLKVTVAESLNSLSYEIYNKADDVTDIDGTSQVYFIQEEKNGRYQIYFGDGIIGKGIPDGGVVRVSYLSTNNVLANKANNFIATDTLQDSLSESLTNFIITPIMAAEGGNDRESVNSIKYAAPLAYSSQNRLVTYKDYEVILKNKYPYIESISVWGGEDEVPPVYGKVFISLKPLSNYYISETEKDRILTEIIGPRSILTVKKEIIDPDYLYILLNVDVKYDKTKMNITKEYLKSLVRDSILTYNTSYLNKFKSKFILSKLDENINSIDENLIIGCESNIKVQKKFEPSLGVIRNYTINFNVPLAQKISTYKLTSNEFYMYDDFGVLRKVILEEVPNSTTGINSVEVIDPGYKYTYEPEVVITGDGYGATAKAVLSNGRIEKIEIVSSGTDYSKATVTIIGDGIGAVAVPVINVNIGTLRAIYYNNLAERQVVKDNIGTIDYDAGIITLQDLNISNIETSDGLMKIECATKSGIIQSNRNIILSINESDPFSITINLQEM